MASVPPMPRLLRGHARQIRLFLSSWQLLIKLSLPTIVAQLGGGKNYSWVGSAFLIAAASMSPAYGKLSDIFGRKQVLYPSILIFLDLPQVGSALCGAAKSMTWLILARALQGIGGGGIQQLVQIVIGDIVTLEERGTYGSFVGAMWGIAGTPRPTGGLAGLMLFFFLNLNPHHGKTLWEHAREFDFVGLFLFVGGVVCLLLGFSQSQNGWNPDANDGTHIFHDLSPLIRILLRFLELPQQIRGLAVMATGYGLMIMLDERSSMQCRPNHLPAYCWHRSRGCVLPPLIGMQAAMPVKDLATSTTTFGLIRQQDTWIHHRYLRWPGRLVGVVRQRLSKIPGLTLDLSGAALADSARHIQTIEVPYLCYIRDLRLTLESPRSFGRFDSSSVLFLKKYSLKRKVIRTGKKRTEVVPATGDDLEKGTTEEVQPVK
ncbi:major facilitator superfamily domain-containing protein [Mycena leptocephala]|nr:major facilitator superfamily domain-containing protein [Mycena leptocephala]